MISRLPRLPGLPKPSGGRGAESLPPAYKPWIVASLAILMLSFLLLAGSVVAAFYFFGGEGTPLWVVVLGGFAVLGIVLGFAGFAGMLAIAGWRSFKQGRRPQAPTDPALL